MSLQQKNESDRYIDDNIIVENWTPFSWSAFCNSHEGDPGINFISNVLFFTMNFNLTCDFTID